MGGGKKSKAPAAPDYAALQTQDATAAKETAELITQQNRPTQNNPFGKMSWGKDAAGNWEQTETWDPRVTRGYDQAFALRENALDKVGSTEFKGPGEVDQFDPYASGQAAGDAMYESYMSRAGKEQGDQQAKMQTQLRQQGLQPGTEAYDRAYKNLLTSQGDVNAKAALDSRVLAGNEARQNYDSYLRGQNQSYGQADSDYSRAWDTAGAANNMVNSQYRPTFSGFSGATGYNPADMSGAAQAQYNSKMGGYNAQQGKKGSTMNAGMGMMGNILS